MPSSTRTIYLSIFGRLEQIEFRTDCSEDTLRELFRCAAEAGPLDIMKVYNCQNFIIPILPTMEENTEHSRYRVEVVSAALTGGGDAPYLGGDAARRLTATEKRLELLEKRIRDEQVNLPESVSLIKAEVDSFKDKLEGVEHLSWLGLFKELDSGASCISFDRRNIKRPEEQCRRVWERYQQMQFTEITPEMLTHLRKPTFNHWQCDDVEMLRLLQEMYQDLGLFKEFSMDLSTLQHFLFNVFSRYNQIPFHNFSHCFCVTQMMYGMIWMTEVYKKILPMEVLILMTAALCHDLDHPGYNNAYQVNARTKLAILYNDISPLENHHASVAFDILSRDECNILKDLGPETYKKVREGIIKCILATDMARHNEILGDFNRIIESGFDFSNSDHRLQLMMILVKTADVSNEARPVEVSEPWLECLLQEFFCQGDIEKLEGLPVAPFMDRDKVTKPSAQIGFIKFVLLPLFQSLLILFPAVQQLIDSVMQSLQYYTELGHATEEQQKRLKEHQKPTSS